ncbi:MAG: hypothetical protein Q4E34_02860 [Synergistaceae bacterium]|nr:hypothetical protein [Synergistaceae bacterium]
MQIVLTVFSAAALLCAAAFLSGADCFALRALARENRRKFCACLLLLPVFLFIPMGALPAFVSFKGSAALALLLVILSLAVYDGKVGLLSVLAAAASLFLLFLAHYARNAGFPGAECTFDLISSVSVWDGLPSDGKLLAVLSCLLLFLSAFVFVKKNKTDASVCLVVSVCCAPAVCIVLPLNVMLSEFLSGFSLYAFGFVCFWAAVFVLRKIIFFFAGLK